MLNIIFHYLSDYTVRKPDLFGVLFYLNYRSSSQERSYSVNVYKNIDKGELSFLVVGKSN